MPNALIRESLALQAWNSVRRGKLAKVEAQCAATTDAGLADELLRGYVILLSAHFQGFCRDLYSEAAQATVKRIKRLGLQLIVQTQFIAGLKLDSRNPTIDVLHEDFKRFGIENLRQAVTAGPDAPQHLHRLALMNRCRNQCAHGAPEIPDLLLANLREWRTSCDWLAARLDRVVYDRLRAAFRSNPW